MFEHVGLGLVPDIFQEDDLKRLRGSRAIGHVLYSRSGSPTLRDAEPFRVQLMAPEKAIEKEQLDVYKDS